MVDLVGKVGTYKKVVKKHGRFSKRVEKKDDISIEMYNHALEVINEIQTAPTRQTIEKKIKLESRRN